MAKRLLPWAVGLVTAVLMVAALGAAFPTPQGVAIDLRPTLLDSRSAARLVARRVVPEYPPVAKVNYIQGVVRLELLVTREGRVSEAHVVDGQPMLAASALKAVRHWVYRPLVTNSRPTPFQTFVEVKFTLRSRKIDQVPDRPERDLNQQVRPPQVLTKTGDSASSASVRMRVLVGETGQALDAFPLRGDAKDFPAARKAVESWKFQPARWGAVRVPWYLEVNVPVETPAAQRTP